MSFTPRVWVNGQIVDADAANNWEQGIDLKVDKTALGAVATSNDASQLTGSPLPPGLLPTAAVIGFVYGASSWPGTPGGLSIFSGGDDTHAPVGTAVGDLWVRTA